MSEAKKKPAEAEGMIMTPTKGFRPLLERLFTPKPIQRVNDALDGKKPVEKAKK